MKVEIWYIFLMIDKYCQKRKDFVGNYENEYTFPNYKENISLLLGILKVHFILQLGSEIPSFKRLKLFFRITLAFSWNRDNKCHHNFGALSLLSDLIRRVELLHRHPYPSGAIYKQIHQLFSRNKFHRYGSISYWWIDFICLDFYSSSRDMFCQQINRKCQIFFRASFSPAPFDWCWSFLPTWTSSFIESSTKSRDVSFPDFWKLKRNLESVSRL